MPNVLGTLSTAIIIQTALDLVFTERPILSALALDFSQEALDLNQSVISRIHAIPTVGNLGDAATDTADVDVSVTLSDVKQVRKSFTIREINSTKRNIVEEAARPMAIALGNYIVDSVAAIWTEANFGAGAQSTTVALAGTNYSTITGLRKSLKQRGVQGRRFIAANADAYEKWLNDSTVIEQAKNANNGGAIQSGMLPNVAGFDGIFEYPDLATASGNANMTAFAASKDSVVYAARPLRDPRTVLPGVAFPGNLGVVTHPSGLSVTVCEYIDQSTLGIDVRLIWLQGVAKGNTNNGQILKKA